MNLQLEVSKDNSECAISCWGDAVGEVFDVPTADLVRMYNEDDVKFKENYDGIIGKHKVFAIRGRCVYKEVCEHDWWNLIDLFNNRLGRDKGRIHAHQLHVEGELRGEVHEEHGERQGNCGESSRQWQEEFIIHIGAVVGELAVSHQFTHWSSTLTHS